MSLVEAGAENTRSVNMAVILRAVVTRGSVSRSELVLQTGLSRKTVGAVVGELAKRSLVEESDTAARGVGRPSFLVRPAGSVAALAVCPSDDVLRIAVVGLDGAVQERVAYHWDGPGETGDLVNAVAAVAEAMGLAPSRRLIGTGLVLPSPHASAEAACALEARLGLPVVVATEGAAATRAESVFGAAAGVREMIYLRCDPGGELAGGVVTGGAVVLGHHGTAGCVTRLDARGSSADARLRAGAGDADPLGAVEERVLAVLGVLGPVLDPEVVVLGGALGVRAAAVRSWWQCTFGRAGAPGADPPRILASPLGDDDLLIGAAQSVFDEILGDPRSFDITGFTRR